MPVSEAEYRRLLAQEEGRKAGPQTSRDDAVRRANIAAGYGNSTALRKFGSTSPFKLAGGGGGKRGGGKGGGGGGGKTAPNPNANMTTPTSAAGFLPNMQTPTSAPGFLPIRGPTTEPSDLPTRGPTTEPGGSLIGSFFGRPGEGGTGFPAAPDGSMVGPFPGRPGEGGTGFPAAAPPRPSPFVNDLVRPSGPSNPHVLPADAALKRMGDENYKSPSQVWQWLFGNIGGRPGGGWG